MIRVRTITKITRLIPLSDIIRDLKSDASDEEIMVKRKLSWGQLAKVYSKLFYGGAISREDLTRRFEMRRGKRSSHIPLVQMESSPVGYRCSICGFVSERHFSVCPECSGLNLRRLLRRRIQDARDPAPRARTESNYQVPAPQ
jgi:hypothetical protein